MNFWASLMTSLCTTDRETDMTQTQARGWYRACLTSRGKNSCYTQVV